VSIRHHRWSFWIGSLALAVMLPGCATPNAAERGAMLGGILGAGTGALIGNHNGEAGAGAAIGGTLGAMGGALVGQAEDAFAQRDAALAKLAESSRPINPPLTNFDLVRMTQAGLGDEVIINAVQSRGGQFQLDPDGLIALKSSGVSDRVLQHVQTAGTAPPPLPTTVVAPPGLIIVRPRPVVGVRIGRHSHHFQRRWPGRRRSGIAISAHHHF